jgi:hypothetical protein
LSLMGFPLSGKFGIHQVRRSGGHGQMWVP